MLLYLVRKTNNQKKHATTMSGRAGGALKASETHFLTLLRQWRPLAGTITRLNERNLPPRTEDADAEGVQHMTTQWPAFPQSANGSLSMFLKCYIMMGSVGMCGHNGVEVAHTPDQRSLISSLEEMDRGTPETKGRICKFLD